MIGVEWRAFESYMNCQSQVEATAFLDLVRKHCCQTSCSFRHLCMCSAEVHIEFEAFALRIMLVVYDMFTYSCRVHFGWLLCRSSAVWSHWTSTEHTTFPQKWSVSRPSLVCDMQKYNQAKLVWEDLIHVVCPTCVYIHCIYMRGWGTFEESFWYRYPKNMPRT